MVTTSSLGVVVVVLGVFASLFSYYAMKECENFSIPDQSGKIMIVTGGNSGANDIFSFLLHLKLHRTWI